MAGRRRLTRSRASVLAIQAKDGRCSFAKCSMAGLSSGRACSQASTGGRRACRGGVRGSHPEAALRKAVRRSIALRALGRHGSLVCTPERLPRSLPASDGAGQGGRQRELIGDGAGKTERLAIPMYSRRPLEPRGHLLARRHSRSQSDRSRSTFFDRSPFLIGRAADEVLSRRSPGGT